MGLAFVILSAKKQVVKDSLAKPPQAVTLFPYLKSALGMFKVPFEIDGQALEQRSAAIPVSNCYRF